MERRKFTRFRAQDDAFAVIRGDFRKVGKIYDISVNGLAFRYIAEKIFTEQLISTEHLICVDVFLSNNNFHLSRLPCRVVYDEKESESESYEIFLYRCGLRFKPLNKGIQNKIMNFINNYTTAKM